MHTNQNINLFFISLVIVCAPSVSEDLSDYYWREYAGVIPSDAIPGGKDSSGNTTYIGQVYHSTIGVLPATIYRESKTARSSGAGNSFELNLFVKILCSRNLNRYKWLRTKNEDSHLLTDCHFVVGGWEAGFLLNIGRAYHEGQLVVGKVFASHTSYKGLTVPNYAKEATYQTYEILTYNCNPRNYFGNTTQVEPEKKKKKKE